MFIRVTKIDEYTKFQKKSEMDPNNKHTRKRKEKELGVFLPFHDLDQEEEDGGWIHHSLNRQLLRWSTSSRTYNRRRSRL
ncbi:hypothetical protein MKW98_001666 [Papaver atlanticum]|uniref:Uncharacterized protein n=1 Tax=Papaver atlanticum TaxID=357466 RepID=A0AAD4S635_9MAGN|nr:hypothetical protein MKW98_001666 [Papaver atlanticum]